MIDEDTIREKLQLLGYSIVTSDSPNVENYYETLATTINYTLNTVFVAIYTFDQMTKRFHLDTGRSQNNDLLFDNVISRNGNQIYEAIIANEKITLDRKDILSNSTGTADVEVISLTPSEGPIGMIIASTNQPIPGRIIQVLREEVENVLHHVQRLSHWKQSEERNQVLFAMASHFLTLTSKTQIFTEIITSLHAIFPEYQYYLLLSQEYEMANGLPVKLLEFNKKVTGRASTNAFLKAEIQIEIEKENNKTSVYAPLTGHQGVYGVLQIIVPEIIAFPEAEIAFINKFASAAGKAIESITLYQNSKRVVSNLTLINNLTHQLNSNLELKEITRLIKEQFVKISDADEIGFVYKTKEQSSHFETLNGSTSFFNSVQGRAFTRFLAEKMEKQKEAIFTGEYRDTYSDIPFQSVMVIPMVNSGFIHGLVVVLKQKPYAFSFDTFKLLQAIIRHSTLAFVNTILKEQLQKAASTDYLTQLYSRNYMDEKITEHMRTGEDGTLILFDIDDFKQVNDTYGHYIGDEVIKQVADIIMSSIEERDTPARWGGEEIAIYLPNTVINDGVQLARRISNQVENFTEPKVTLSAGVSSWSSKAQDTPKKFFVRADQALYEAKGFGKNCVVKNGAGEN